MKVENGKYESESGSDSEGSVDERDQELEQLRQQNEDLVERLDKLKYRERELVVLVKKAETHARKREENFKKIEEQFNWANILKNKKQRENDALMMEKQRLESKIKMAQTLQARAEKLLLEEQKEVQRERSQRLIDLHKHQKMVEVHTLLDAEFQRLRIADMDRLKDQQKYEEKLERLNECIQRLNNTLKTRDKELEVQEQQNSMLSEQAELLQQKLRDSMQAENSQRQAHKDLLKAFGGLQQAYSVLAKTATAKTVGISKTSNDAAQRRLENSRDQRTVNQRICPNPGAICRVFEEHHIYADESSYTPPISEFTSLVARSKAELKEESSATEGKRSKASKVEAKQSRSTYGKSKSTSKQPIVLNKMPKPGSGYVGNGLGLKKNQSPSEQRIGALLAGNPATILRRLEKLKANTSSN